MRQFNDDIKSKLFNYFKQRLNKFKESTKGWYRANCPFCGGAGTFGVHIRESRCHCFKCGEKLSPFDVIVQLENFTKRQEVFNLLRLQEEFDTYNDSIGKRLEFKEVLLPDEYQNIAMGESMLGKAARHYLKSRRFDIQALSLKGIGYCTEGKYAGYIIFPVYFKGNLVFFQTRRFLENAGPKMKNPAEEDFGIGKSKIVYNLEAFYIYRKVYLFESITNAETIGDNAGAILGKVLSPEQKSMILSSPVEKVVIGLDRDASDYAIGLAMQLAMHKKVKVVFMPTDDDVNKMGKKKFKVLEKTFNYSSYHDLFRLKLNHDEKKLVAYN